MSRTSEAVRDSAFLTVLAVVVAVPTVAHLGFASDDWVFLTVLAGAPDQSVAGLVAAQWQELPRVRPRPLQALLQAGLFAAFGQAPLGYHLVIVGLVAAAATAGYLLLRELSASRLIAVAAAALFVTMPHYSSARLWFAAFGYVPSVGLALASVYADARAARAGTGRGQAWKAAALVALVAAGAGYEVVLPLLAAGPVVVWAVGARRGWLPDRSLSRLLRFAWPNLVVLAAVMAFKTATAFGGGVAGPYALHLFRLGVGAAATHYGSYGLALPDTAWWGVRNAGWTGVMAALLIGAATSAWLLRVSAGALPAIRWRALAGAGLVAFALGYAIFLTTGVDFTSTGIANRTATAAATGVAVTLVAVVGAVAAVLPARAQQAVFAGACGALCLVFTLTSVSVARFWALSYAEAVPVVAELAERFPDPAPGTTVVVDGLCPYRGPAIVFDSAWDLTAALTLAHGAPRLSADVYRPQLEVTAAGLESWAYGSVDAVHAYGEQLIVYDLRTGSAQALTSARKARAYEARRQAPPCPPGAEGTGVDVLPVDRWYRDVQPGDALRHLLSERSGG